MTRRKNALAIQDAAILSGGNVTTPPASISLLPSSGLRLKARNTTAGEGSFHHLLREQDWQEVVVSYARIKGWTTYHTHDSRRSDPGFPDLVLVRGERLVFAEIKAEKGRLRPDQEAWLRALRDVPSVEVHCWRPSDWVAVRDALC